MLLKFSSQILNRERNGGDRGAVEPGNTAHSNEPFAHAHLNKCLTSEKVYSLNLPEENPTYEPCGTIEK